MRQSPSSDRRFAVAGAIFIVCSLLSSVRVLTETPTPSSRHADNVAERSDWRFAALKTALPKQGIVGYMGSSSSPADYYLAQYALAPVVVDNSTDHPWVVGNFTDSVPVAPLKDWNGLELVKDFGKGVMLFARHPATSSQVKPAQVDSAHAYKDAK
jgi:hypothetical protein